MKGRIQMSGFNPNEAIKKIDLTNEVTFIKVIENYVDSLTIPAKEATTIVSIKNSLSRLSESLLAKNEVISGINQYFSEEVTADNSPITTPLPKVNGPKINQK